MSRLLVAGGAGFIGCNLASRLIAEGADVIVLDDLSRRGAADNLEWLRSVGRFEFVRCDIRDRASVAALFQQHAPFDAVFHLAAQVAVTQSIAAPREDFEVNLLGTLNLLETVRRSDSPPAFIYASTNKVYGKIESARVVERPTRYEFPDLQNGVAETLGLDFYSPYGCSKGGADQYVRDYARIYGLRTVVLRQSCIFGPRQFGVEDQGWVAWFVIAHLLGFPLTVYGTGKQVRDLLYIDDLVKLYLACLEHLDRASGEVYNVGGGPGNTASILEVLDTLQAVSDRQPQYSFKDWRPGDQRVYVSDISKAARDFGWTPRVSVAEGVERLYRWVGENRALVRQVAGAGSFV